ncbi:hypothetical protein K440DRAFT_630639 [Wilcoxina mikolae CBS 423.85]|nr:hypothetical protein K440DRAFT_630639 [Wilcoxina mikolae CBS 423.85]
MATVRDIHGQTFTFDDGGRAARTLVNDGVLVICGLSAINIETNSLNQVEAYIGGGKMKVTTSEFVKRSNILTTASLPTKTATDMKPNYISKM